MEKAKKNHEIVIDYSQCWKDLKNIVETVLNISRLNGESPDPKVFEMMNSLEKKYSSIKKEGKDG